MKATVNLDLVSNVAGSVVLFGDTHDVLDLDGEDYRFLNSDGVPNILAMYELAQKLVPSLGDRAVKLTAKQIVQIVAIADGRIKAVEAVFPNGSSRETIDEPTSPASP